VSQEEVLSGVVDQVVFERPATSFVILRVRVPGRREPATVVGQAVAAQPGQMLRAEGAWQNDKSWGEQFKAQRITLLPPSDDEALISFLGSGAIKGVGEAVARKLVQRFGGRLGEVIDRAPERLREVPGIGPKLAQRISQSWQEERGSRDILLFLHSHGIRPARARRILEAYGEDAVRRILADPYLLARDVRGIGFQTADALARRIGIDEAAPVRRIAALIEALRHVAEDGHSACERGEALARAAGLIGVEPEAIAEVLDEALEQRRVVAARSGETEFLLLPELRAAELGIARHLRRLSRGALPWPEEPVEAVQARIEPALGITLAASQIEAIAGALRARTAIITGGPGTGKTTLVKAFLAAIEAHELDIALAAPTGRAARRLAESTGREASTIHRMLEADPVRGFARNADRRLECDLLVLDEVSMVDLTLMNAVLQALPDKAGLVLVGDADQLPPVGPGQVLADLIESGRVPVFHLTEIFRQAAESSIVMNAHRVIQGQMPQFHEVEAPDSFGIRAQDSEDALTKILELVTSRMPERFDLEPVQDIQILSPVNRGPAGTRTLNERLQAALNPAPVAAIERHGYRFGVGDKVMQTENDYSREIYNGDLGRIETIDGSAELMAVRFDERLVSYAFDALEALVPAYATTVHKAQGSEYPAVLLLLMREHGRMLRRQLLYTAMTRARRLLVIVAQPEALERAVATPQPPRRSLLNEEIAAAWQAAPEKA